MLIGSESKLPYYWLFLTKIASWYVVIWIITLKFPVCLDYEWSFFVRFQSLFTVVKQPTMQHLHFGNDILIFFRQFSCNMWNVPESSHKSLSFEKVYSWMVLKPLCCLILLNLCWIAAQKELVYCSMFRVLLRTLVLRDVSYWTSNYSWTFSKLFGLVDPW